jgi:hypothetical protein
MNGNNMKGTRIKATKTKKTIKTQSKSNSKSKTNKSRGNRRKNLVDDGYIKTSTSASDLLTGEQIKERIKNYDRVYEDDILELKPDDKIAYFEVLDDGKFKYKPGGYLLVNGAPDYLVLTSSKGSWSVQIKNHIIFKSKDIERIEERHRIEMDERIRNENQLRQFLIKQKKIIEILRARVTELEEVYEK